MTVLAVHRPQRGIWGTYTRNKLATAWYGIIQQNHKITPQELAKTKYPPTPPYPGEKNALLHTGRVLGVMLNGGGRSADFVWIS